MNDLSRLEDLPPPYLEALARHSLVPLWPSLRALLPPGVPTRKTQAACWPYAAIRPLLMQAGELTPIDKAERRVLVLANPGHGPESLQATAAIYLGMQLLLPGEWAPAHRHTPNAVRLIVEGQGATTTVAGEQCVMERGDLVLTPTGQWHEHAHAGRAPVVWLDVLDLPLVHYLEASYHVNGPRQGVVPEHGEQLYAQGGLVPSVDFERAARPHPMLRYPWAQVRAALLALATNRPGLASVQVTYTNPETGGDAQPILGCYAQMLRPGQRLRLPVRSPAMVLHLIEGAADVVIGEQPFALAEADTCCAPGYTEVTLSNRSAELPAFLFIADETPLHKKLGVFENRG